MNLLTDLLPTKVYIEEYTVKINPDFRTMIQIDILFKDDSIDESQKWETAFDLFYIDIPFFINENYFILLAENLISFYSCGHYIENSNKEKKASNENREHDHSHTNQDEKKTSNLKPIFCFKFDAEYIYSAFLHDYKIDLQKENLHWWVFNSLFKNLSEENEFVKIMKYRSIEIDKDMSPKEKEFYKKMKKRYALPTTERKVDVEHKNALEEALLKGESIDHLV